MAFNKKSNSLARPMAVISAVWLICAWAATSADDKDLVPRLSLDQQADAAKKNVIGREWQRKTLYHSPQTPGYTCWVGAWQMSDKSSMVSFKQATGPVNDRPHTSEELLARLGRVGEFLRKDRQRDFTGLTLANI